MLSPLDPRVVTLLDIVLRVAPQSARAAFAGKLPHQRDEGAAAIAKHLTEQLARSGWQLEPPPPPLPDRGK